jgi:hypothetical protein
VILVLGILVVVFWWWCFGGAVLVVLWFGGLAGEINSMHNRFRNFVLSLKSKSGGKYREINNHDDDTTI